MFAIARGQTSYTQEFKNTIVEFYNSGKSLTELSNEYALSKSNISGWILKNKPVTIDSKTTITMAEHQALLKENKQLEEEIEIFRKAMDILVRK